MKKLLLFFTLLVSLSALMSVDQVQSHAEQTYVYICNSKDATKYHLASSCQGLNACKHEIIKVTKEDAYEQGKRTLCGWED